MLYTMTSPTDPVDRVRLFPTLAAVVSTVADAAFGRPIYGVAARFDERSRRLTPLRPPDDGTDPRWTTPAQPHGDDSITARAPIPASLYAGRITIRSIPRAAGGLASRPAPRRRAEPPPSRAAAAAIAR